MFRIHRDILIAVGNRHEVVLGKCSCLHEQITRLTATHVYQLDAGAIGAQSIHQSCYIQR